MLKYALERDGFDLQTAKDLMHLTLAKVQKKLDMASGGKLRLAVSNENNI